MPNSRLHIRFLTLFLVLAIVVPAALAGDLDLQWDATAGADGYKVFRGLAAGNYGAPTDVGNVLETPVSGLADCTTHFFAVTAYNAAGDSAYSNEVSSWARPRIASVTPASAEQDRSLDLVLAGMNFQSGAAVAFSDPAIAISSVAVNACSELVVSVTIGPAATPGPVDVSVTLASGARGTAAGAFRVEAAVAPTVSSTSPADGASGVGIGVRPTITFSEPVGAGSVTASSVRLLDANGVAVAQASGSPSLDASGTTATIVPRDPLVEGRTYRTEALGGASGVRDLAGHPMASTYTQATGFATVADTTAPTLTAVRATGVGATSATIEWTTDEPADGRVYYRASGETAYRSSALDADLVLDHAIALEGLVPSTLYEYHVESTDGAGNTATSSPDATFTTTSSAYAYLRFEAEAGDRTGAFALGTGAAAFLGEWIEATAGGTTTNPSGTARFGVHVPTAGTWFLWIRMYAGDPAGGRILESFDGGSRASLAPASTGTWTWVAGRQHSLGAGLHEFELGGRDAGVRADRVLLTDDPGFVPTETPAGDNAAPAATRQFAATGAVESVELSWSNPSDADFARTVIRYRTDGRVPVSPHDGYPVLDRNGAAGASESYVHPGLDPNATYTYGAFAIDASGNVADVSAAEASPLPALQPPPAPTGLRVANP